jgi:AraC-like DNA-binding protein
MDEKNGLIQSMTFDSLEALQSPVGDSCVEIVQLGGRSVAGSLAKATLGDISFSRGHFSGGLRAAGVFSQTHLAMGILVKRRAPVAVCCKDFEPGDLVVQSPGGEHYVVYSDSGSFLALLITPADVQANFASEPVLSEPDYWSRSVHLRPAPATASKAIGGLLAIFARLEESGARLSEHSTNYWRHAIIEAFTSPFLSVAPTEITHMPAPLRLIREVERFVDERGEYPVHISEICVALRVTRRTLHRAFHDILGIGPIAFLRCKRLSAVHTALSRADPSRTRIIDVATEFGFAELGRFASHYLNLFGESPSETLRKRRRP